MRLQIPGSELIVNVGTQKQLFVDDHIIETTRWISPRLSETARWVQPPSRPRIDLDGWSEGVDRIEGDVPGHLVRATAFVTRTVNRPERFDGNPILEKANPWEDDAPSASAVIYDDGLWKMWYLSKKLPSPPHRYCCLYATSHDGIRWERPALGVVKDGAGRDTNIVLESGCGFVLKDEEADPSRRYKLGLSRRSREGLQHPMLYHSPDGIHWTPDPGPFSHSRGDEVLSVMHDPLSRKYLGFCRNAYPKPMLVHRTERFLLRMQSNDLVHWSMSEPIIEKDDLDPFDSDFYGMSGMCYERIYLGFVNVHHTAPDTMDVWLAHSRDSFRWKRLRSRPFMPTGPAGSWEGGMVMMFQAPVRVGDEHWVFYRGTDGLHDALGKNRYVGLAKLRLDGFVSIDAYPNKHKQERAIQQPGKNYPPTLLTKPLASPGNRLVVNVDAAEGFVAAELLDVNGYVIDGFSVEDCDTFRGDSLAHTISWRGNPDIGGCLPARIRFAMNNVKLYALQIPKV